jgi:hypothetical protein
MKARIIAVLAALTLAVSMAGTALADGADVEKHGHGTMGSAWSLDVEDQGRNLEVDFEIDTAKAGQAWRIVLKRDGNVFFKGVRTTQADGEVEVDRLVRDHQGSDRIVARGVNPVTGEVCRGALTI